MTVFEVIILELVYVNSVCGTCAELEQLIDYDNNIYVFYSDR